MLIKTFKIFLSKFDNFNKKYVIFENSKINLSLEGYKIEAKQQSKEDYDTRGDFVRYGFYNGLGWT